MFKREAEGDSSMTISAQVIDTIVEWIDDNLHQPLRIEEIARHAGSTRSGTCSGCLCSTKGRVWGVISVSASCCWRRAICVNPTLGCTTSACVTGLTRSRRLPVSSPARSTSRLGRTARRTTVRRTELFSALAGHKNCHHRPGKAKSPPGFFIGLRRQ